MPSQIRTGLFDPPGGRFLHGRILFCASSPRPFQPDLSIDRTAPAECREFPCDPQSRFYRVQAIDLIAYQRRFLTAGATVQNSLCAVFPIRRSPLPNHSRPRHRRHCRSMPAPAILRHRRCRLPHHAPTVGGALYANVARRCPGRRDTGAAYFSRCGAGSCRSGLLAVIVPAPAVRRCRQPISCNGDNRDAQQPRPWRM
jgi:hypothetical protein